MSKSGEYIAALDWFQLVYDYTAPIGQRVLDGLFEPSSKTDPFKRQSDWLLDPLNPHSIAETRANTYTRFTLLSLIKCLLDYADAEFTRDTTETLPRARSLYMTALELLDTPELKQQLGTCAEKIRNLNLVMGDPQWVEVVPEIVLSFQGFNDVKVLDDTLCKVTAEIATNGEKRFLEKYVDIKAFLVRAKAAATRQPTFGTVWQEKGGKLLRIHSVLLAQPGLAQVVERVGNQVGDQYLKGISQISGMAPTTLEVERVDLPWLRGVHLSPTPELLYCHLTSAVGRRPPQVMSVCRRNLSPWQERCSDPRHRLMNGYLHHPFLSASRPTLY